MNTLKKNLPLNDYAYNKYSQNGEDGIIAEILKRMSINEACDLNWCVEFGAWDGIHLSNTFALVEKGWHAVYIEGDSNRFNDLLKTVNNFPRIMPVNAYISPMPDSPQCLDAILSQTLIPKDFTLLSIDIDSFDLDVWQSVEIYRPKIVVIEINSNVPPGVIWRHSSKTQGNTFSATLRVAEKKGYTLVCHTGNLIFIRDDHVSLINMNNCYIEYPELLFLYDGKCFPSGLFDRTGGLISRILPKKMKTFIRKIGFL